MIARLTGELVHRDGQRGILDVQGVGYAIHATSQALEGWSDAERCEVWVSTQVREDAITLYAFATDIDRQAFEVLLNVKGVGPKAGLATLDTLAVEALSEAVESDDLAALSRIPGVGKRTAQRLALELKGKLPVSFSPTAGGAVRRRVTEDPMALALARLDYGKSEIDRALMVLVQQGLGPDQPLEKRLGAALRILSGSSS